MTNGYRGVQPIFAIKPGASGDITLKEDQTQSEFDRLEHALAAGPYIPTPVIYGDHLYVLPSTACWPPTTSAPAARLPAARRAGRIVQRVASRGRRKDLSRARTATSSSSRPGRRTSCWRPTYRRGGDGDAGDLGRHALHPRIAKTCSRSSRSLGRIDTSSRSEPD